MSEKKSEFNADYELFDDNSNAEEVVENLEEIILGLAIVLKQIRTMYTNVELQRVIDAALAGRFQEALYDQSLRDVPNDTEERLPVPDGRSE